MTMPKKFQVIYKNIEINSMNSNILCLMLSGVAILNVRDICLIIRMNITTNTTLAKVIRKDLNVIFFRLQTSDFFQTIKDADQEFEGIYMKF